MNKSNLWQQVSIPKFPKLHSDIKTDILVIGGGLSGILCAYRMAERHAGNITLIDAQELCGGVTAHTTAKITSQHGLIYNRMVNGIGIEGTSKYASINEQAISDYESLINSHNIDCDFVRCPAYIYSSSKDDISEIEQEALTMQVLGVSADYVKNCELPLPITGAIRYNNQAKFHPLKFAQAIIEQLTAMGVKIYTNTPATAIEGRTVHTAHGKIAAQNIIITTHFPFINLDSWFFVKMYQERSYVLALSNVPVYQGMYLSSSANSFSFRSHNDFLLFGGAPHKTGHESDTEHYAALETFSKELYPNSIVSYKWSAQDCMTHDSIPFIGPYDNEKNIYVATGFNKWGMTSSMTAANIISQQIEGGSHPCESVFDPMRIRPKMQGASFIKESADIAASFIKKAFSIPSSSLDDIEKGEGAIVSYNGKRVGVYRDEQDKLHGVEPVCTHMLCPLYWNRDEKTWDCPCHGSRFEITGEVIGNPALNPLKIVEI